MKVFWKVALLGFMVLMLTSVGIVSRASSSEETCSWTIDKTAKSANVPITDLTLHVGQSFLVNYSVSVDVSPSPCTPFPLEVGVHDPLVANPSNPYGLLGWVFYGVDTLPKVFSYSGIIGPYAECGDYVFQNTALLKNPPLGRESTWIISVHVPCGGCTLTPGYWKTHSEYGPAPYDDTWALLSNGADTPFFLSGQSWYDAFWTSPSGGNAYYILAHAYMAAKLNLLNETESVVEVTAAIEWAEAFFATHTPAGILTKSFRNEVIGYATILDNYNNGLIGPGHCSE